MCRKILLQQLDAIETSNRPLQLQDMLELKMRPMAQVAALSVFVECIDR
jgi:hypothetical protein